MADAVPIFTSIASQRGQNGAMRIITNGVTITKTRVPHDDLGHGGDVVGGELKQDLPLTTKLENYSA